MKDWFDLAIYYDWPIDNLWLGVSVSTQEDADKLIPILLQIPAAVRIVSVEPCLGDIDLTPYFGGYFCNGCGKELPQGLKHPEIFYNSADRFPGPCGYGKERNGLDWAIIGCESGPKRRPCKLEWIEGLIRQCNDADVPVFCKQAEINGKVVSMPEILGRIWGQMPKKPGNI